MWFYGHNQRDLSRFVFLSMNVCLCHHLNHSLPQESLLQAALRWYPGNKTSISCYVRCIELHGSVGLYTTDEITFQQWDTIKSVDLLSTSEADAVNKVQRCVLMPVCIPRVCLCIGMLFMSLAGILGFSHLHRCVSRRHRIHKPDWSKAFHSQKQKQ